jgi:alanine racemase
MKNRNGRFLVVALLVIAEHDVRLGGPLRNTVDRLAQLPVGRYEERVGVVLAQERVVAVLDLRQIGRRLDAGERMSYGLRYRLDRPSSILTVPIGYADGVPRRLFEGGGEVLVGGKRRPLAGTVTMDQILVDMGDDPAEGGEEVVLIGQQGSEEVTATEWAERLGTIAYEICCAVGPRVPRRYHG